MSIPPTLTQPKDASTMSWLMLKFFFLLENLYGTIQKQAYSWLRFWLSVKAPLSLASIAPKFRNKRAILVGLVSVVAFIFTWRLRRNRRVKPCPTPKETNDLASSRSSVKSSQETISSTCQLVRSEDTLLEEAVQQDLHVTHCETTALCFARTHGVSIGGRCYPSKICVDEMDTLVFEKRQIEESSKDMQHNQINPVSGSTGFQTFDLGKQKTLMTPSSEANPWEAPPLPNSFQYEPLMHEMRKGDSEGNIGHVPLSTSDSKKPFDDIYVLKSVHNLEVLPLPLHDRSPQKDTGLFRNSNPIKNENTEAIEKALDVHQNVQTFPWTTSLFRDSDLAKSDVAPIDPCATKDPTERCTLDTGLENKLILVDPYLQIKDNPTADVSGTPCIIHSTLPNYIPDLVPDFPAIGRQSMVEGYTQEDLKYENKVPLSQPADVTDSLHQNAWYDSELISRTPPHKLHHLTNQHVDMYKLVDVAQGDENESENYDLRIPQGSYREKIHTYDKYLADPKLSAQMRSQVQRAKIYLQRYYELDSQEEKCRS